MRDNNTYKTQSPLLVNVMSKNNNERNRKMEEDMHIFSFPINSKKHVNNI